MAEEEFTVPTITVRNELPSDEDLALQAILAIDQTPTVDNTYGRKYGVYWRGRLWPLDKGAFNSLGRATLALNRHFRDVIRRLVPYTEPTDQQVDWRDHRSHYDRCDRAGKRVVTHLRNMGILSVRHIPYPWSNPTT